MYLPGASHWFPRIENALVSFSLEVDLPTGWTAVSQGERSLRESRAERSVVRWVERQPQDAMVLAANRFHVYQRDTRQIAAFAFLLRPERELARRYLEATAHYVLGYSVTNLGGGQYRYEYALQNLTSDQGADSFSIPLNCGRVPLFICGV